MVHRTDVLKDRCPLIGGDVKGRDHCIKDCIMTTMLGMNVGNYCSLNHHALLKGTWQIASDP